MANKFYTFHQNNSGGSFTEPAIKLIVEASNADEAANIAIDNGVYFNGVDFGSDCPCCGDRWTDYPDESDEPEIYGLTPEEYVRSSLDKWYSSQEIPVFKIIYK